MRDVLDYVLNSGLFGLGALFAGIVLLAAGALMINGRRLRAAWLVYMALALGPLALGYLGSMLGGAAIDSALASSAAVSPAELERARRIAASPLEIGGAASAVAFLLGVIGLALGGARAERQRVY